MKEKLSLFDLRLRNKLFSELKKMFRFFLKKRTNYPFLSGDGFASFADYIVTEIEICDSQAVASATVIFVPSHLLETFLSATEDINYKNKILLLGNSDRNFTEEPFEFEKFLAVYCQNAAFKLSEQVKILPIGLENLRLAASGFKFFHKPSTSEQEMKKVLFPPMSPTNAIRVTLTEDVKAKSDLFDYKPVRLARYSYFKLLKKYKFVFVCEGNGFDSHRLWEVLYQGSFPVVLETPWSENLKSLNLPILYVNSVNEISEELLNFHNEKHRDFDPIRTEILWLKYWAQELNLKLDSTNGN
jgi:hypothetical protein